MNFSRKGWTAPYVGFRAANPFQDVLPSDGVRVLEGGQHHELDQAIYYFLQPTGLLYGFPVGLPFPQMQYPNGDYLNTAEKAHLIFMESLFACLIADRHYLLEGLSDETDHFAPVLEMTAQYFGAESLSESQSEASAAESKSWPRLPRPWGGKDDPYRAFEEGIGRRLGLERQRVNLSGNYYNSFLFLELHYCRMWQQRILIEPERGPETMAELNQEQRQTQRLLIRLMIAAATADGAIDKSETRLINWFIKSAQLPAQDLIELREALARGLKLEDVPIPPMAWLLRRFILEAILMTMLVDRDIQESERRFLADVVGLLGLWQEELEQSFTALEVFLIHQKAHLSVLHDRSAMARLSGNVRGRAQLVLRKNLTRIVKEIRETQELYNLMMKSTKQNLTPEEKIKVRKQLMDILKTIPALAIFALPGGGLILPVLIKLLPFNLLPSAFEEE